CPGNSNASLASVQILVNPAEQCSCVVGVAAVVDAVFHSDLHSICYLRQSHLGTLGGGFPVTAAEQSPEEAGPVLIRTLLRVDVVDTGAAVEVVHMDVCGGQCLAYCSPGAVEVGVDIQYRIAGAILTQRAAALGRCRIGSGQRHRGQPAGLVQIAFQLSQQCALEI